MALWLSYDAKNSTDSLGAQILRLLATFSIAKKLQLGYRHVSIENLYPDCLDIKSPTSLTQINEFFKLPDLTPKYRINKTQTMVFEIHQLTSQILVEYLHKSKQKNIELQVTLPFNMINHWPELFKLAIEKLNIDIQDPDLKNFTASKRKTVIHFRQGENPQFFTNSDAKSHSSYLAFDYFETIIKKMICKNLYAKNQENIIILTDLPVGKFNFTPHKNTKKNYKNYDLKKRNTLTRIGFDIENSSIANTYDLKIIRGDSALSALKNMMTANILILSNSALSYLGGLLQTYVALDTFDNELLKNKIRNRKTIKVTIFPPGKNFSLKPLTQWQIGNVGGEGGGEAESLLRSITKTELRMLKIKLDKFFLFTRIEIIRLKLKIRML